MRFLVRIEARLPPDLAPDELARLNAAETARGVALIEAGTIEHIWRLDGRRANVGIWNAPTRQALDEALDSLPLRQHIDIAEVSVLLPHPVTVSRETVGNRQPQAGPCQSRGAAVE